MNEKAKTGQFSGNEYLGTEPIGRLLARMALPAIIAQVVNVLYNIVDRMYIGRLPDSKLAMAGLGLAFPILILVSAFAMLVGTGGAAIVAIRLGEGDRDGAEKLMGNSFTLLLVLSAVLTAIFYVFKSPLLMLFGASPDSLPYAESYTGIYILGTVFVQISLGMNAFINTQGFASTGMKTVLIGAAMNILLDPIFIYGFGLGVRGAAIATVLAQMISAVWVLAFLFGKKTILRIRLKTLGIGKILLPALALGLSPFVMQATEALVNIVLNSSLQHFGGDDAVSAMTILASVMQLVYLPLNGLGQGAQPIVGYNYGAKKYKRVKKTFRLLLLWCVAAAVSLWAIIMLFPGMFYKMFSKDDGLLELTVHSMRIFMGCFFMMGVQCACQQTFIALGQAKVSLFLALLRKVILLVPLVYILGYGFDFGVNGVLFAEPIADMTAALTTGTLFFFLSRKLLRGADDGPETEMQK